MLQLANYKELSINGIDMKELYADGVCIWKAITSRIPSEYQEVEYIKAADNVGAYINLGFAFDTKAKVYISQFIGTVSSSSHYGYLFGAAENSGTKRCMLTSPYLSNGGASVYGSTGSSFIAASVYIQQNAVNEFELILQKGKLSINNISLGKVYTMTQQGEYTMTSNLYLFAQNYNGSARFGYNRTIKAFKYYDKTDTLICDLVPCYRKSDGVVGMYDVARKTFLTNAGSGTFTKGADV